MTDPDSWTRATGVSRLAVLARVTAATLLVLAAPAVSFLLTTGVVGSGASIRFPDGYAVMVIVTVLVTVAASALGARIAGRAGFAAIRFVLAWWAIISFAVVVAGVGRARMPGGPAAGVCLTIRTLRGTSGAEPAFSPSFCPGLFREQRHKSRRPITRRE